jgi:hypothetical protein
LDILTDFAVERDCAVIGIHHNTKGTQGRNLVERASGSLAIGAVPRIMLFAAKNRKAEDDPTEPPRIFGKSKGNIGRSTSAYGYTIENGTVPTPDDNYERGCVRWLGQLDGDLQTLADEAEQGSSKETKQTKSDEARKWLAENIGCGEELSTMLCERAAAAGISPHTLRKIAPEITEPIKGRDGRSYWRFKAEPKPKPRR